MVEELVDGADVRENLVVVVVELLPILEVVVDYQHS